MNEIDNIKNLIYKIRDEYVMLDSDLAILFNCINGTKVINQAVKRNINKFPEEFCFKLTDSESKLLKSKCKDFLVTICDQKNIETRGGRYKNPYVFTESGIIMLSSVLKSQIAIDMSVNIVRVFVEMRKFISNNAHIFERLTNIEYKMLDYDKKFNVLFDELQKDNLFEQKIFYNGQIYDSFSLIIDILRRAENEIIIMDNYIDKNIIDILSFKNDVVKVIIITDFNKLNNIIVEKFNNQYPYLKIINSNTFHDRFIIIDDNEIYHVGASLKDIGKKCFAISKIEDYTFIEHILTLLTKYN